MSLWENSLRINKARLIHDKCSLLDSSNTSEEQTNLYFHFKDIIIVSKSVETKLRTSNSI